MKRKYLLLIIIIVAIISCKHKEGNFSVTSPAEWVRLDSVNEKGRKKVYMHAKNFDTVPRFVSNISITIYHYSGVDNYMNSIISESKNDFAYFEEVGTGVAKVNRYTAKWMLNVIQPKGKSYLLEQRVYFIEDHGNIYMITCTAKVKQLIQMENEINTVLNSFEILS